MVQVVIYARVSTKEQQAEGYSIPAQLKAIRAFCEAQGFDIVSEFVEAESAGRAGRTQFGAMLSFLRGHPEVRTVVAHKLDRLYRNFADQVALEEELGIRARYVEGDVPDTPQGMLTRDVQLSVSKYYLGNLREEVKKGMDEKVAQGGWPHKAPLGYLNDRSTRTVVKDPATAPLLSWAFERYASGAVSLAMLTEELHGRGLLSRRGGRIGVSALHHILSNPFYAGRIPYKGDIYPGIHEPLVSVTLFDEVQARLSGNRNGTKKRKPTYPLRGTMHCGECGCLITAGTHKGHVYYRCTHGKGECSQRSYIREETLETQIEELLTLIALDEEVMEALAADCELLLEEKRSELGQGRLALQRELSVAKGKEQRLLDAYLDGTVPADVYREKADVLASERRALELRISEYGEGSLRPIAEVRDLMRTASAAAVTLRTVEGDAKREVIDTVLCNLTVEDGRIASYQYKDPFGLLVMEPSGAFCHSWWAL